MRNRVGIAYSVYWSIIEGVYYFKKMKCIERFFVVFKIQFLLMLRLLLVNSILMHSKFILLYIVCVDTYCCV